MTLSFGTDGLRGVANQELTVELVTALARATVRILGAKQPFVVGRDTRRSGPMLEAAFVAGLCAEGADVELVGVLPTPGIAHLAREKGAAAAVVSASHNPYSDNGIKLFAPGGRKITDAVEAQIETVLRDLAVSEPGPGPSGDGVGVVTERRGAFDDYAAHLLDALEGRRLGALRAVVDCANGAAFRVAPSVLRALGTQVDVLNAAPDGTNVNADCGSTDPTGLRDAVRELGADVGLGFDGDADRVVAVDERGELVDGDQILAIAALDLHDRGKLRNNALVATVMSNLGLRHALAPYGIDVVETPVGDRNVLDELERRDLVLGGEQSGHIIFTDYAATGDGTLTGLFLLDVMTRRQRSLSELAAILTRVPQVLRSIPVADPHELAADGSFWTGVQTIADELGSEGRVLVRPSGTEPVVRVMVEAPEQIEAERVAEHLVELVLQAARRSMATGS